MTPPAGIRSQFNNTNTGSHMASGGGGGNANSFRPPPPPTGNVFGNEGCGEELAFMSATTTASNARLPGMPVNDELPDEVKNFRGVEESSPSRPRKSLDYVYIHYLNQLLFSHKFQSIIIQY